MAQKTFIFNPNRCLGCRACQTACSLNHNLPPGVFLRKVVPVEFVRGEEIWKYYLSTSCNHCANPECFRLCPNHAFRKRRDGIVIYNEEKCKGCGTCTRSCPFKAPTLLPTTGKVMKCDLCFGKLDEKEIPYCIAACPADALLLANSSDPLQDFLVKTLPGVPRIQITRPATLYYPLRIGNQVFMENLEREANDAYELG